MNGKNNSTTGMRAQCMAQIVDAENPSISSLEMALCSFCGFILFAIHLQNEELISFMQDKCKSFAEGIIFYFIFGRYCHICLGLRNQLFRKYLFLVRKSGVFFQGFPQR